MAPKSGTGTASCTETTARQLSDQAAPKNWLWDGKLHREDGPAVEEASGTKEWLWDGKLHREDGPADERRDGSSGYS
jgi:hypothetical protein